MLAAYGSSPRVRGTRPSPLPRCARLRFIPACAGNSLLIRHTSPYVTVHPRVCGELAVSRMNTALAAGSSPRVRGTRDEPPQDAAWRRFIPACAGNSPSANAGCAARPVHPRVCGELDSHPVGAGDGSRFIPACAGNSTARTTTRRTGTVHPRVCGELREQRAQSVDAAGSSPRVRGTRRGTAPDRASSRFIPACAGNSAAEPSSAPASPVHPRVCGELESERRGLPTLRRFIPACAGNSPECGNKCRTTTVHPRVCGELVRADAAAPRRGRFIPACAGNSARRSSGRGLCPVHPRVCGELALALTTRTLTTRFIPACAGNSQRRQGQVVMSTGSSPRVRGTRAHGAHSRGRRQVHPRVCGELDRYPTLDEGDAGSSPRVRGSAIPSFFRISD